MPSKIQYPRPSYSSSPASLVEAVKCVVAYTVHRPSACLPTSDQVFSRSYKTEQGGEMAQHLMHLLWEPRGPEFGAPNPTNTRQWLTSNSGLWRQGQDPQNKLPKESSHVDSKLSSAEIHCLKKNKVEGNQDNWTPGCPHACTFAHSHVPTHTHVHMQRRNKILLKGNRNWKVNCRTEGQS